MAFYDEKRMRVKHYYVVVYEINGEEHEFRVIAEGEDEASTVCFYEKCWEEDGQETYKQIRIYEEPDEWVNEEEYVGGEEEDE